MTKTVPSSVLPPHPTPKTEGMEKAAEIKQKMQPDLSGTRGDPSTLHRGWTFWKVIVAGT